MSWLATWRIGIAIFLLALAPPVPAAAQTNGTSAKLGKEGTPSEKNPPTQAISSFQQTHAAGPHDTIKVHGHWTIVIRNPDGSIASRHDFENALSQGQGDLILASVLSRNASVGSWVVVLDGQVGGARPCNGGTTATGCQIREPNGIIASGLEDFPNLTVQQAGASKTSVVLSGSAKSTNGGQIKAVSTMQGTCDATVLPSACGLNGSSLRTFTTSYPTPITVLAGQSIDVTVTISFS
jgi:hypothetical protein